MNHPKSMFQLSGVHCRSLKGALLDPFKGTLGVSWFGLARAVLRLWGFMGLEFIQ